MDTTTPFRIVRDDLTSDSDLGQSILRRAINQENTWGEMVRDLAGRVGGLVALESLGADPLPDEAFDLGVVQATDQLLVAQIVALIDDHCDRMHDVEYRTIARRLLARVLANDSQPLRRSSRPDRFAAGIMHAVLAGNGRIGRLPDQLRPSDVAACFGTSSASDRARTLVAAAHFDPLWEGHSMYCYRDQLRLPLPELLHSSTRKKLLVERQLVITTLQQHEARQAGRRPTVTIGGRDVGYRCSLADVLAVTKGRTKTGETMVLLGLSPLVPETEVELFALTLPEAYRLADVLNVALSAPTPARNRLGAFDESWDNAAYRYDWRWS
jgi:hypothetical protein